jgi:hypothetical protein
MLIEPTMGKLRTLKLHGMLTALELQMTTIGNSCAQVIKSILENRAYPVQDYRSCLGILRLGKSYPKDHLEAACQRAIAIRGCSYQSIRSILEKGLDGQPLPNRITAPEIKHKNIRGKGYYL